MKFECHTCNRNFASETSLNQHNAIKHAGEKVKPSSSNSKKYLISTMVLAIAIFSIMSVYSYSKGPGKFDDFANCLKEKGVIMYGNDFCSFTIKQLNFFGKSQKHINYIKCIDNEGLCDKKGIKTTPTWEYKGQMYPQVQTFEKLSAITGCKIID